MPYVIPDKKIAMFFCPKGGGTSLRAYMFHVENGFPFRPFRVQGKKTDANALVRNFRWQFVDHDRRGDHEYFCVVRDPVRRFLSGFGTRIFRLGEADEITGYFNARYGIDGTLPRLQTGGPKLGWDEVPEDLQARVLDIVRGDIAFGFCPDYHERYRNAG